jgi:acetylornithine deacetylase
MKVMNYPIYLQLLQSLIKTPSISRQEDQTAELFFQFLDEQGLSPQRLGNNVWVKNRHYDSSKPSLLLNSHHDTVKPNKGYTRDPFEPSLSDGKIYGLGSNDAGGALIALLAAFLHFEDKDYLPWNLIWAGTAEEEISGMGGIASIWKELGPVSTAIVGEPTQMQMAVAEKGLMVLDGITRGQAGHAARNEGKNAIYLAIRDIEILRNFTFPKASERLGPININVTQIEAGQQHNVVPDECRFVVDVRTTDAYSNEETLQILQKAVDAHLEARSLRLQPSFIEENHPLVQAGLQLGMHCYGSPTLSDQALMPVPSLKLGPGDSSRSHTADEFIHLEEFFQGIDTYIELLETFFKHEQTK